MLINETTLNCCKPKRFSTFTGSENSKFKERKVTAKHYHQMSDDVLSLHSVVKAHKEVENSAKMRLYKAMPEITTALVATSLALTQPGKLSAKAGAGLGFLVLSSAMSVVGDTVSKIASKNKNKEEQNTKDKIKAFALGAATVAVGALAVFGAKNTKFFNKASNFIAQDVKKLADEVNNSKFGKFVEKRIQKNQKELSTAGFLAPFGVIAGSFLGQIALADSLSQDIKEKAQKNFLKGKLIQQQAKAHYDSIDAKEI